MGAALAAAPSAQVDVGGQSSQHPFSGQFRFSLAVAPHGALSWSDSVPERWSLLLAWPGNLMSTNPDPPWTRSQRQARQAQGMPAAHRLDLQK